jgi:hypothetical protein
LQEKREREAFVRLLLLSAASLCALAGPAAAETYRAAAAEIEHAAAVVTVIPEDRVDMDVQIEPGTRLPAPSVRLTPQGVVIDGGLRNRIRSCTTGLGGRTQVRVAGVGNVARDDLPHITIRAPLTLDLAVGGGVYATVGASQGGKVALSGCGDTSIGAAAGALDLSLGGSGDADAGLVSGQLTAALNGSGSLRVAQAGAGASLRLNGSGDVAVGDVAGALDARVNGSGGIRAGDVGGGARLALSGSGDIDAGAVSGSLEVDVRGSGDVTIASVQGERATLNLASSGDIVVRAGRVDRLDLRDTGSGDVRFGAVAGASRIALHGSGDISVADAGRIEQLRDSGSGDVSFGR